ncbi:carboxylesterase/lipase family protein [Jiulongibacter sp. NS-SX5]|uniref:carboxylesterase/lipase family protein n=1 Tax=Jiulongibacter sp. NS-SX5 TaxID=3463854 RepID=UPI004059F029
MKLLFSLLLIPFLLFSQNQIQETVSLPSGKIKGYSKNQLTIFKGIPFAAPPVNELRWKAPQPVEPWSGIKETVEFSASPFQNKPAPFYGWSKEFIAPPSPLSEDCLYLNVWTSAKETTEKLPVFVWIYGGGFSSGSAACDIYDGESYAKNGVVFVSINYRVGPFGFLAHPELSEEQGGHSGNYGFMDQVAGLEWVKENIAKFGGDPNNISIGGQSAGSMSVHSLMASEMASGLFQKAVAMSGGWGPNRLPESLETGERTGLLLQKELQLNSINDLRAVSAEEILAASQKIPRTGGLGVIRDGLFLKEDSFENRANKVPVLTGWTKDDGAFLSGMPMTRQAYIKDIETRMGDKADEYLKIFNAETDEDVSKVRVLSSTLGFAGIPTIILAADQKEPVYIYEVKHVPTDKPDFPNYGAFHTSDVPYALQNLHTWDRPWQAHDLKVEATLSSYFLNFIKTGNPNGSGLPEWNSYNSSDKAIQVIDEETRTQNGLYEKELNILIN